VSGDERDEEKSKEKEEGLYRWVTCLQRKRSEMRNDMEDSCPMAVLICQTPRSWTLRLEEEPHLDDGHHNKHLELRRVAHWRQRTAEIMIL
jgi:hypothetical protein